MMKKDPQIESEICRIYDLLAEDQEEQAEKSINEIINQLKALTDVEYTDEVYPAQAGYFLQWGRCLEMLEEPEQALLKWEKSLNFDPDSQETLWAMASCLIYTMNRPESAIPILEEKLLKLNPDEEQYQDALKAAQLGAQAPADFPGLFPDENEKP